LALGVDFGEEEVAQFVGDVGGWVACEGTTDEFFDIWYGKIK
jgi:hypothetical protein